MHTFLQKYNLTAADLIGQGMEASVYRYSAESVLKFYQGTANAARLQILQTFYASLDARATSLHLPKIHQLWQEPGVLIALEKYLPGQPMSTVVAQATPQQLPALFEAYWRALRDLQKVKISPAPNRYRLFDEQNLSLCVDGDFHAFLWQWVARQVQMIGAHLARDVHNFSDKLDCLRVILAQPYEGPLGVVHGDFFPGNLLIEDNYRVTAMIDFGLFTLFGDPLFDVATGWVFFDMYDVLQLNLRAQLLDFILTKLGTHVLGRLQLYVLLFSIVGANAYSDCTDGHYAWCVMNLNDPALWANLACR